MNEREKKITELIKNKIKQKDPTADVFLFGSHARGQAQPDSDWDILILTNKKSINRVDEKEYRHELFDIELEIGEVISAQVFSKTDWENRYHITPLYANIKRDGIQL